MKTFKNACLIVIITLTVNIISSLIIIQKDFLWAEQLNIEVKKKIKTNESIQFQPTAITIVPQLSPGIRFVTTGYYGEQITFLSAKIYKLIETAENGYSVGDYVTSTGMLGYDGATALNYIDVIRVNSQDMGVNKYMRLHFKKEDISVPSGSYCDITGIVGNIFSNDSLYLDQVLDLKEISIDKVRIIEACSSSLTDNANIIVAESLANEKLKDWMSREYGMPGLLESHLLGALNNMGSIGIDYDFREGIAKCRLHGNTIETGKDLSVRLVLEFLYNSHSDSVEKIDISFVRVLKGSKQ